MKNYKKDQLNRKFAKNLRRRVYFELDFHKNTHFFTQIPFLLFFTEGGKRTIFKC